MTYAMNELKKIAQEEKIDLIGVANLSKIDSFRNHLVKFENMDIVFSKGTIYDKINYLKVWDKTKSIISFGVHYKQDIPYPKDMHQRGKLASFTYGEDYHKVLKKKATDMMTQVNKKLFACDYKVFIDTGTLSDRVIAYAAGLGFYGKNGFIIDPTLGSLVFLGHILINAEITQNEKFEENKCTDCRKCIDACPTGAIQDGRKFDYQKCISYQTQKGHDTNTHGYIYGCDICQNICPFNQKSPLSEHLEFITTSEISYPYLTDVVAMSESDFKETYGMSALNWRGYQTLKNNAQYMLNRNNVRGSQE